MLNLKLLKKEITDISNYFDLPFVNFYNFDNKEKDEELYQIKNSFFGYCYILENKMIFIPENEVNFDKFLIINF